MLTEQVQANLSSVKIQKLIRQSKVKPEQLGLLVVAIGPDKSQKRFELNSSKSMIPASLAKLATAGAVLDHFSPTHLFSTRLHSGARIEKGVLLGDLYLVGGGDSGFVSESMWQLVNEFVRSGITEIQGSIVVDDSRFDGVAFSPSRSAKRVDRAFDAPVSAMSFNWNSTNIYVRPGAKKGDPVRVWADPDCPYIEIINRGKTTTMGQKIVAHRKIGKPGKELNKIGDQIIVTGTMGIKAPEKVIYRSISRPTLWSGSHLKSFLARRGVVVKGGIRKGKWEKGKVINLLADLESRPLGLLVRDMMKFSNNYVAEMLTKNLAYSALGRMGTIVGGVKVINQYLHKQLSQKGFTYSLVNPSGLSRKNKMSVAAINQILINLSKNFSVFPEFVSSLPTSGSTGTLKRRMSGELLRGWVRAKTGTLNGVTGLAGFAGKADGTLIRFSMLYNGPHKNVYAARDLFNKIVYKTLY